MEPVMATKLFLVVLVIGLTFWIAQVQSQLLTGTPRESSTPPKNPTANLTQTTSPAECTTSSTAASYPATTVKPNRNRYKVTAEATLTRMLTPLPSHLLS